MTVAFTNQNLDEYAAKVASMTDAELAVEGRRMRRWFIRVWFPARDHHRSNRSWKSAATNIGNGIRSYRIFSGSLAPNILPSKILMPIFMPTSRSTACFIRSGYYLTPLLAISSGIS